MSIRARGGTTIARPIEDVFDYVADPRNEPKWLPGATAVEKTSEGPVGLGATFVGSYDRAGRVELQLVKFDRPRMVTFRAHSRIVDFDDVVELSQVATGTRLQARMVATPRGVMRLLSPMMARTLRRQCTANWDHLRRALEAGTTESSPPT
jgi:carbon monoxide dehydrogenase subunit G